MAGKARLSFYNPVVKVRVLEKLLSFCHRKSQQGLVLVKLVKMPRLSFSRFLGSKLMCYKFNAFWCRISNRTLKHEKGKFGGNFSKAHSS